MAPKVRRVAILRDPTLPVGLAQFGAIQSVASSFGVEVSPIDTRGAGEIAHAINAFALKADGGLIFVSNRQSMPS